MLGEVWSVTISVLTISGEHLVDLMHSDLFVSRCALVQSVSALLPENMCIQSILRVVLTKAARTRNTHQTLELDATFGERVDAVVRDGQFGTGGDVFVRPDGFYSAQCYAVTVGLARIVEQA